MMALLASVAAAATAIVLRAAASDRPATRVQSEPDAS